MTSDEKLQRTIERFQNHRLEVVLHNEEVQIYRFAKPGSSNLAQEWIFRNERVIVTGDCYDSIYWGGPGRSLQAAAKCNLGYFSSKCVADADGRDQSRFDSTAATESIHEAIIEHFEDQDLFKEEDDLETKLAAIETDQGEDLPRGFDDEWDTVIWLRENERFVGSDWWESVSLNAKNIHPYFHLAGMIVASSQEQEALQRYYERERGQVAAMWEAMRKIYLTIHEAENNMYWNLPSPISELTTFIEQTLEENALPNV